MALPESLEEVVRTFKVRMEGEEKSPCTVKQYAFFIQHFLEFVNKPALEVTRADIERYREHLVLDKRYTKSSVYLAMRALSYFFRTQDMHSMDGVDVPRRAAKLPNFLNEDETHRLLESARGQPRLSAMLHLLCYGGLRVGELCRLELQDLDLDRGLVKVRKGKGDKDRILVIDDTTVTSLREWISVRGAAGIRPESVFGLSSGTVERLVRRAAKDAGIQRKVTPHTLRHTLATTLLRHGLDIRYIQKQLGHASVATTEIYTHVDTEALQEAYKAAKPKY
jgi:integrase/recombinase XerD